MRTTLTTMAALAALAWLPPAMPAAAQEPSDSLLPFCKEGLNEGPCGLRPFPPPGWIPCQAGEHGCDTIYSRNRVGPADPPEGWRVATVADALEYLRLEELPDAAQWRWSSPEEPAIHILRQVSGPRASAELDAFADQVAAIATDTTLPGDVRRNAKYVLMSAASSKSGSGYEGTPYPRAVDLLARLHDAGIVALSTIMLADSVRGLAYVRELFERSERPPLCRWRYDGDRGWIPINASSLPAIPVDLLPVDERTGEPVPWRQVSPSEREALERRVLAGRRPPECEGYDTRGAPWCEAGGYLFDGIVAEAWDRAPVRKRRLGAGWPYPVPEGLPEHVADWHRRCR